MDSTQIWLEDETTALFYAIFFKTIFCETSILGEMIFDQYVFKWVETTTHLVFNHQPERIGFLYWFPFKKQ